MRLAGLAALLLLLSACGASVPLGELPRPLVLATIGASDAAGIGASSPARTAWPAQLVDRFPQGARLVNPGVDGHRVADALREQLPVVLDAQPDIIAIWISVNDLNARTPLGQYERDLDSLLAKLGAGGARLFLANVPNLSVLPAYRDREPATLNAEIARWNSVIAVLAARHGAVLVDLNEFAYSRELATRPDYISGDGFHPNDAGYKRLADLFWDAMLAQELPRLRPS